MGLLQITVEPALAKVQLNCISKQNNYDSHKTSVVSLHEHSGKRATFNVIIFTQVHIPFFRGHAPFQITRCVTRTRPVSRGKTLVFMLTWLAVNVSLGEISGSLRGLPDPLLPQRQ